MKQRPLGARSMMGRFLFAAAAWAALTVSILASEGKKLNVVTTLPDYAVIAKRIGGDRVTVEHIVRGDQDAHFIRPKPSFVDMTAKADVLVCTGLDLELWLPVVINKSGNTHVRSGQPGFVSCAAGVDLLEKPTTMSRIEGGLHVYGNPHITCSPLNMKVAARNIAIGLIKNDAEGKAFYLKNLKSFQDEIDRRLFGEKLIALLGSDTLCELAAQGKLVSFLRENQFQGKPLIDSLGGWLKEMLPMHGTSIVTYHKNWVYFNRLFGLQELGTVEPKPGIPPSPKHVEELLNIMRQSQIRIIFAANYFDEHKIKTVAERAGAEAVIVPLYVGGVPEVKDYFQLVDYWVGHLLDAAKRTGLIAKQ
ncbi:MAG: zinc ABC transporter substrate-binding protein [Planctomycetes bacterium]|nr:zinc ABC transporter substrate-binding protein [Planctomycetota bacterium]